MNSETTQTQKAVRIRRAVAFVSSVSVLLAAPLTLEATQAGAGQWLPQGPRPTTGGQVENIDRREVVGAVHALAPHPTESEVLFVGTVNGGIWRTVDASSAAPQWEALPMVGASLSIGALEFDPTDRSHLTLVAGIGRFSSFLRVGGGRTGVIRTIDGGDNWVSLGADGLNISGIVARNTILVVSADEADDPDDVGIWRSTNDGASWTRTSGAGLPAGPSYDLVSDPSDPDVLFTNAGWDGIYRSDDLGDSWTAVGDSAINNLVQVATNIQMSVGTDGNLFVAIVEHTRTASNGDPVHELTGLYRSPDGLGSWAAMDLPTTTEQGVDVGIHSGGQGQLHLSLVADPVEHSIVYVGGDSQPAFDEFSGEPCPHDALPCFPNSIGAFDYSGRLFRVDAEGAPGCQATHITHSNTLSWSAPHSDSRDMAFTANGDLIEVDDGGVYRRTAPRTDTGDWKSMIGDLQATEFVNVAWDSNVGVAIGGAQDTGAPQQDSRAAASWRSVQPADGGDVAVDNSTTPGRSVRFSSFQYLGDFRWEVYDASNRFIEGDYPALRSSGPQLVQQFDTPIELNNVDPMHIVFGANNGVYESDDRGENVHLIGAGIRVNAVGADPIAYGGGGNQGRLYVGSAADVFVRDSAGGNLVASANYPGTADVADIVIHPDRPDTAIVIDQGDVYVTGDAGSSWDAATANLTGLDPGRLLSVEYRPGDPGSVYVGASNGVFASELGTWTWARLGTGLPQAPVYDLDYDRRDDLILAGTLGRGAWTLLLGSPPASHE